MGEVWRACAIRGYDGEAVGGGGFDWRRVERVVVGSGEERMLC